MARRRRSSANLNVDDLIGDARSRSRDSIARDDESASEHTRSRTAKKETGSILDLLTNTLLLAVPALLVAAAIVPSEMTAVTGSGLLLVMLWILLFVVWSLRAWLSEKVPLRFNLIDLLIVGAVGWHSLSALLLVSGHSGHARPAINMGWEWIAFGICYFIVRQMFTTYRRQLALLMVIVCLATTMASCGLFQYFHTNPTIRRSYENSSESKKLELLAAAGVEKSAEGSRDRALFEERLASVEPLATFILTNSLAGVLVPWSIVAFGFLAVLIRYQRDDESGETDQSMLLGLAVCLLLLLGCLLLTKSRAAFLAATVGTVMIVFTAFAKSDSMRRVIGFSLGGILLVFVIFAFWVGGLDLEVFAEAPMSIKYRLEYWYATAGMIRENPMFGVGPGNFQDNYMQHMLPQSSEEISDPHNFLFELASTAGLPAAMMFATALGLWFYRVLPTSRRDAQESPDVAQADLELHDNEYDDNDHNEDRLSPPHNDALLLCGGLIGVGIGVVFSYAANLAVDLQPVIVGMVPAIMLAIIFVRYLRAFRSLDRLPLGRWVVAATVAFLVNLLAAGGIGFPGVALGGFVLLALGLNIVSNSSADNRANDNQIGIRDQFSRIDRTRAGAFLIAGILLAVACQFTALKPVMQSRPLFAQAEQAIERRDLPALDDSINRLKKYEKYDSRVQELVMRRAYMVWENEGFRSSQSKPFVDAVNQYVRATPRYNGARRQVATGFLNAYRSTADPDYIRQAIEHLEAARDLRPSDGLLRAQLAWALQAGGDPEQARKEAQKAAEFDRINKHIDRRLAGTDLLPGVTLRDEMAMSSLVFPPDQAPADAEQWVDALRIMEIPDEFSRKSSDDTPTPSWNNAFDPGPGMEPVEGKPAARFDRPRRQDVEGFSDRAPK